MANQSLPSLVSAGDVRSTLLDTDVGYVVDDPTGSPEDWAFYFSALRTLMTTLIQGDILQGAEWKLYGISCTSTSATPREMFIDGDAGSDRIPIPDDTLVFYLAMIAARRTDADNEGAAYFSLGAVDRNAGTVAFVGNEWPIVVAEDDNDWGYTRTADDTNKAVVFHGVGEAGKTVDFKGIILCVVVTG